MEDRLVLAIVAVIIVVAPFIAYLSQGRNGGVG